MKENRRISRTGRHGAYLLARLWHSRGVLALLLVYCLAFVWLFEGGGGEIPRPSSELEVPDVPLWESPGGDHWFGTTGNGSDLFTLSRIAMAKTMATAVVACGIGASLSLLFVSLFAFDGGRRRFLPLRGSAAAVRLIPVMAILCVVVGGSGGGFLPTVLSIAVLLGLHGSVSLADWMESSDRRNDLVAGTVLGLHRTRLLKSRILPHCPRRLAGLFASWLPLVALAEMALAYLGMRGDALSCGSLVASGKGSIMEAPWVTVAPGILAGATVMGFTVLGAIATRMLRIEATERWI